MSAKNTKYISYTLSSEDDSVERYLKFDNGNCFIEAKDIDVANFRTGYPSKPIAGLYWGRGLTIDGEAYDTDYSYTSIDRVSVSGGVAKYSLKLDRLPMYAAYLINIEGKEFNLMSISINGVEVSNLRQYVGNKVRYNLAKYTEDYMSYRNIKTLEYSVVVQKVSGEQKTLTASIDLSKDNKLLIDGSII